MVDLLPYSSERNGTAVLKATNTAALTKRGDLNETVKQHWRKQVWIGRKSCLQQITFNKHRNKSMKDHGQHIHPLTYI